MKVKKLNDSYVEVDGDLYEKIEKGTSSIDLDLDDETDELLQKQMKSGHYVNKQEVIRHVLRDFVSFHKSKSDVKQLLTEPVLHDLEDNQKESGDLSSKKLLNE
jgi:Arc/MetJ-type ribon-helix-helix transcriptional regulator